MKKTLLLSLSLFDESLFSFEPPLLNSLSCWGVSFLNSFFFGGLIKVFFLLNPFF
ncbi:hypothetical protein HPSA50_0447 [Helicobacter pylori SouthAfrica50]|uniref:Uncharacterized protein n=1 Tax=Helicobacter pylori SouthAfrica50 TaxID=1352357 RepID=T2SBF1_HELPX|nr:hypothetical protein HPSA50_0447 [Helicobacter pylori SouthAfrica50]